MYLIFESAASAEPRGPH